MNLDQLNRILLQTLLLPVVALLFVAAVLAVQLESARNTVAHMQQAESNIATATLANTLVIDEETGLRGYEVTSNEIFLQPYNLSQASLDAALRDLRAGLEREGDDPGLVDNFIVAHDHWRNSFAAPMIAAIAAGKDVHDTGLNLRGKAQMDALRARMSQIVALQKFQRDAIVNRWQRQAHETLVVLVALLLIMGLAIGFFDYNRLKTVSRAFRSTLHSLRRQARQQRQAQTALLATEKLAVAGRLAATLAHEIHNPLDAVGNLLYLMRSANTPEESAQFLDLARKELDRVTQISRAMLGLYRESKTPVAVDVKEMLENILLLLDSRLRREQIEVQCSFAPNASVNGFPAELRQVFLNLLTNAVDASAPGSKIRIVTTFHGEPGSDTDPSSVAILIADNGSGIADAARPRLFQPFFTTKGEHGTGLGLWVSRGIVEKHGGRIEIESHTGGPDHNGHDRNGHDHGTSITVLLPRSPLVLPPTEEALPAPSRTSRSRLG